MFNPQMLLLRLAEMQEPLQPDKSGAVTLTVANAIKPGSFLGIIRIHTNDANKLVVDIPFEHNTGGALAPKLNSSPNILANFSFAAKEEIGSKTKTITLSNLGNIPLKYRILTALSAKVINLQVF